MEANMRIATYLRVSKDGQTVENQRLQLTAYATSQGWEIVADYHDDGFSGSNGNRPAFHRMLNDAAKHQFDLLLVYAVDRISREGAAVVFATLSQLTGYGVKFHSFSEPHLSTVGPFGDVVLAMYATFAKLERDKLIERTKAGLTRARSQGRILGRPKRVVDTDQIVRLRNQGVAFRAIAEQMDVDVATVYARWKKVSSDTPTSTQQTNG
jgi:DNA invertase Pin-like site-specific DNA recombinase